MTSSIFIMSHDIYQSITFLSRVDWCISWLILSINDVINVEKGVFSFFTFITSSMVKMSHAIYQSTRLKKCSRLIYISTHYDHRWRHKCKKTRFYYQGVSPRWIYPGFIRLKVTSSATVPTGYSHDKTAALFPETFRMKFQALVVTSLVFAENLKRSNSAE